MSRVSTRSAERVLDVHNSTGESPVWHAAEQALYWVDIPAKQLHRLQPQSGRHQVWSAPEMLACIVRGSAPTQWVVGAESGLFALDTSRDDTLGFTRLAAVDHALPGMRFNDGRCDRQGRFLAGTMLMDMAAARAVGQIYQLQADGALRSLLQGFITPNGMAFSPDGRTMYLSDSHASVRQVWAYDYDTAQGLPTRPRPFIDMAGFAGRPDGAAMDTDGCYWICGNDAGLVHRYTPAGVLDMSVALPAAKPAMCAFGGADMRTLYITTIRPAGSAADALDGGLFAIHLPAVQGLAEPALAHFSVPVSTTQNHFQETP
ncbi:gluconolactonase [Rhodoferax lacus]|uniref:Gluconolactonase n=1 Tax=Rhodoferax lacus TaxID=2184758 RepID=A0A3E1RD30_9BURK|nr:SMP-30/gluconolactonase/LRE family protein [Rhodoferax lacus]RFO97268.1 gluconolactonase [Rhodoferax lacus]